MRNRRVSNVERNNLEEETTIGNQFRYNLQKYGFRKIKNANYCFTDRDLFMVLMLFQVQLR